VQEATVLQPQTPTGRLVAILFFLLLRLLAVVVVFLSSQGLLLL
jgi:hypothetical protein